MQHGLHKQDLYSGDPGIKFLWLRHCITIVASDWPRTFFTARLFLFSISLLFVTIQKQNILL